MIEWACETRLWLDGIPPWAREMLASQVWQGVGAIAAIVALAGGAGYVILESQENTGAGQQPKAFCGVAKVFLWAVNPFWKRIKATWRPLKAGVGRLVFWTAEAIVIFGFVAAVLIGTLFFAWPSCGEWRKCEPVPSGLKKVSVSSATCEQTAGTLDISKNKKFKLRLLSKSVETTFIGYMDDNYAIKFRKLTIIPLVREEVSTIEAGACLIGASVTVEGGCKNGILAIQKESK